MLSVKFADFVAVGGSGGDVISAFWFGWLLAKLTDRMICVFSFHCQPAQAWLWREGSQGARELYELLEGGKSR